MKHTLLAAGLSAGLLVLGGCSNDDEPDAYGNFEATEVTVSAETSGQLLRFGVEEGEHLTAPRRTEGGRSTTRLVVGLIDTTQLALERRQLRAQRASLRARLPEIAAQVDVLETQLQAARRELARQEKLEPGVATTEQRLDQARDEVRTLYQRIEATRVGQVRIAAEIKAVNAQIARVEERIRDSRIINPVKGTALNTYVEAHEFVQTGQPLYRIADLDTMILRAYVSGAQLSDVRVGEHVRVFIDESEDKRRALPGRVTWIANEAEFTPTPIQTREERIDLVYAVEIRVPNPNGAIKIGMPAEVVFGKRGMGEIEDSQTKCRKRESGGK